MYIGCEKPSLESLCYGEGYDFASMFASDIYDEAYLAHYGVKGMKWGVRKAIKLLGRRFRRKSKVKTSKKKKVKKADRDTTIKSGTKFQRIVTASNSGITKGMYVSYKNSDKDLYKGVLARMRANWLVKQAGDVKVTEISMFSKEDIRIPSKNMRIQELDRLLRTDEKAVKALIREKEAKAIRKMSSKQKKKYNAALEKADAKKLYNRFNDSLSLGVGHEKGAVIQKFYSNLAKKGYNAIPDENDIRLGTFKAKAPIIVFDAEKSLGNMTYKDLTASEIFASYDRSIVKKVIRGAILPKGVGFENLKADSSKEISKYAKQLIKDQQTLNPNYSLQDLADDWSNRRFLSFQIKKVSKLMDTGKTHEEAADEIARKWVIGNMAVNWFMDTFNIAA